MLKDLYGQVIHFQGSLLGFKELDAFEIQPVDENGLFAYLLSLEEPEIGFVVTSPFSFYRDYSFELDQNTIDELGLKSHEEAQILTIITLQEPFKASTLNLLAPVVVNVSNWTARQIVLPPHYNYKTKVPMHRTKGAEEVKNHADLNT